jgi:hypothetical protein
VILQVLKARKVSLVVQLELLGKLKVWMVHETKLSGSLPMEKFL